MTEQRILRDLGAISRQHSDRKASNEPIVHDALFCRAWELRQTAKTVRVRAAATRVLEDIVLD